MYSEVISFALNFSGEFGITLEDNRAGYPPQINQLSINVNGRLICN